MTSRSFIFALRGVYPAIGGALCALLLPFSSCIPPVTPDDLLVSSCRFEPPLFDSFRQNTKLSYTLNQPATVSVYILDQDRKIVKTIAVNLSLSKGSHSHGWKGDSDELTFVPTGIYIGQVNVRGKKFETTVEVFHW